MIDAIQETLTTPVIDETQVLVLGGGPAGYAAAIAAARGGAEVTLVERYGHLGGLGTGGYVLYMDCLFDRQGKRWTGGVMWETLQRLEKINGLDYDHATFLNVDSELFKIVAEEMCLEAGVRLRYHSWAVAAIQEGPQVKGAILESKAGRQAIRAKICIDGTGDGDLAASAGALYTFGKMRIALNMKVAGVDWGRYQRYIKEEPAAYRQHMLEVRRLPGFSLSLHGTPHRHLGLFWVNNPGLGRRQQVDEGDWRENDLDSDQFQGELSALDPDDLTYVEIEIRQRLWQSIEYYRQHIPGFERAGIVGFASQVGVRDSRHIHGDHLLTKQDVLSRQYFEDTIGLAVINYAQDIQVYPVPYRCLTPLGMDGLLTAGRCISVDDWVINSIRLIPACVMIGQAAGSAAALAVQANQQPKEVDLQQLRRQLAADGAILEAKTAAVA